jgi:hypothetical protein
VGHVVVDDEAIEAHFLQRLDDRHGVRVAVAQDHLGELLRVPGHVPQVDVEQPASLPEVAEGVQHALAAAHLGPAAVAEVEAVHRAAVRFHGPGEVLEVAEELRDASQRRHGRIVGMERHPDAGFLTDG